jgi:hypothetical protein
LGGTAAAFAWTSHAVRYRGGLARCSAASLVTECKRFQAKNFIVYQRIGAILERRT